MKFHRLRLQLACVGDSTGYVYRMIIFRRLKKETPMTQKSRSDDFLLPIYVPLHPPSAIQQLLCFFY